MKTGDGDRTVDAASEGDPLHAVHSAFGSSIRDGATITQLPGQFGEPERGPLTVSVPGYEIESVLGRGGMGVVYKALHLSLKRTVALKMILAGGHAGPRELARFRIEAEAVARLQHPNIVQIHEIGVADGRPYFALEFVEGDTLADTLGGKPLPPREAARLVEALARAMQLAHSRNVVHRDLKPANILLSADGTPKITDFGLARQIDRDSAETMPGAVMGTAAYMAPEQASGRAHEAGPAADIYALGAILYDCLVGRPPFKGVTEIETLDHVRTREPTAPSRLEGSVPLDLDTICLKCLRKEPEKRYASAAELADELVRYQRGEPILARPVGRIEKTVKWVRRNPSLAASLVGVVAIFITAFVLVAWSYWNAEEARSAERWGRYRSSGAAAYGALQLQNHNAARSALDDAPQEHRNWEWHFVHSQLDGATHVLSVPGGSVDAVVSSPSSRQVAVRCYEHNAVYLYDVATAKLDAVLHGHSAAVTSVAYRPDGRQIATAGNDQTVRLWDPANGHQVALLRAQVPPVKPERGLAVAYNADGSRLASFAGIDGASGLIRLWDPAAAKEIAVLADWQEFSNRFAFSPDGKRLAAGSKDYVYLSDATTGQQIAAMGPHAAMAWLVAYSPDGKRIASATAPASANDVHLWDGRSGKPVAVLRGHTNHVDTMVFSPDGSRLVTWGDYPDYSPRLWDAADGRLIKNLAGHKNRIQTVAFSPDSNRVVSTSTDQTARVWDARSGQLVAVLSGHTDRVPAARFNPEGTRVVTASNDSTLRLWDSQSGVLIGVLRGHSGAFHGHCPPVFTPDGSRLISGSTDGTLRIWDTNLFERNGILRGHEDQVYDVAFSPDGENVASSSWDGTTRVWDATTCRQTALLKHESRIIPSVEYSRDGRRLVTVERERGVTLWNIASQKPDRYWRAPTGYWGADTRAAVNPAGTIVAAGCFEGPIRLWDVAGGNEIAQLRGNEKASTDVAFHPGGDLLASAGEDGTVRLFDVAKHNQLAIGRGHTGPIWRIAFSADGKLLASAGNDKTICLWEAQTLKRLAVIRPESIVYGVAFSPDGTRLAAACRDNTIRLYDVARHEQVAELRGHGDFVHAVAWSLDGTRLVSCSGDFTVRVWDMLPAQKRGQIYRAAHGAHGD